MTSASSSDSSFDILDSNPYNSYRQLPKYFAKESAIFCDNKNKSTFVLNDKSTFIDNMTNGK